MSALTIEICCGSAEDVFEAQKGGAHRVELNSSLFLGGLTPTLGTLRAAREQVAIPIVCMVRPREGGFCYTHTEFDIALRDAELMLENGADGLAFGFLRSDGSVDEKRCRRMLELAGEIPCVFHRAVDVTPDWKAAFDVIMELGFARVLTSGQCPSAVLGAQTIRTMVEYAKQAGSGLQILPGAGIKPDNARHMAELTCCDQLHMSLHKVVAEESTSANPAIHFGGALYPPEDSYKIIDRNRLAAFMSNLK